MMETKFGIPWIKSNCLGAEATKKSLRRIARFFVSTTMSDRVEEVIAREMLALEPVRQEVKARCHGSQGCCAYHRPSEPPVSPALVPALVTAVQRFAVLHKRHVTDQELQSQADTIERNHGLPDRREDARGQRPPP